MSRLQFKIGAGHRRGRARQTRPMRSRLTRAFTHFRFNHSRFNDYPCSYVFSN